MLGKIDTLQAPDESGVLDALPGWVRVPTGDVDTPGDPCATSGNYARWSSERESREINYSRDRPQLQRRRESALSENVERSLTSLSRTHLRRPHEQVLPQPCM